MKTNLIKFLIFTASLVLTFAVSCETYETADENHSFSIAATVEDSVWGADAVLSLRVTDGFYGGESTMSISLTGATGATPSYTLLTPDGATAAPSEPWEFAPDGTASFRLRGLPKGTYNLTVTVSRWYHSSIAKTTFRVL